MAPWIIASYRIALIRVGSGWFVRARSVSDGAAAPSLSDGKDSTRFGMRPGARTVSRTWSIWSGNSAVAGY